MIISIVEFLPNNLLAELPQHLSRNRVPGPCFSLFGRVNLAIGEVGAIVLVQSGFEGGIHVCCCALREGLDQMVKATPVVRVPQIAVLLSCRIFLLVDSVL